MTAPKFYVQIDRDNGTRTYKGAWTFEHCQQEARAWRAAFNSHRVTILPAEEIRPDVRAFDKAVKNGGTYRPADWADVLTAAGVK